MKLNSGNKTLDLSCPVVMGILNATPDSFSDGGKFNTYETACLHADEMIAQGAKIIDVGGESTRPGAPEVSLADELERVIPLIQHLSKKDVWISIDTSKAEVMRQAIDAGANIINDVRALQEPGALDVAAEAGLPVCLMHMQGTPRTMQTSPEYRNVIEDICEFFKLRIDACIAAGVKRENIILDPGFGFGKTLEHNLQILANQIEFHRFNLPVLIGLSRKSMFDKLCGGRTVEQRLAGSLAGAMLSAQKSAHILRVHDVEETQDVLDVFFATQKYSK
ncbi:dihydropteroate synthase [Shewanella sp. 202IG2-18]|uniref:dihydropteroate synthase n=1 Tax=Parashewanella hymeniacidonis TaxID=2807618 RepID=UPI00196038B9|nr:dihydropteroate synthase [Parashewanella hymeniacidonis]MBM7070847.1 dihydropteroate synthase [Parashewanella hymeniacidonis]